MRYIFLSIWILGELKDLINQEKDTKLIFQFVESKLILYANVKEEKCFKIKMLLKKLRNLKKRSCLILFQNNGKLISFSKQLLKLQVVQMKKEKQSSLHISGLNQRRIEFG